MRSMHLPVATAPTASAMCRTVLRHDLAKTLGHSCNYAYISQSVVLPDRPRSHCGPQSRHLFHVHETDLVDSNHALERWTLPGHLPFVCVTSKPALTNLLPRTLRRMRRARRRLKVPCSYLWTRCSWSQQRPEVSRNGGNKGTRLTCELKDALHTESLSCTIEKGHSNVNATACGVFASFSPSSLRGWMK